MNAMIGVAVDRVDGPAKVTGTARYAAEFAIDNMAYGAVVLSTIPCGRVARLDTAAAARASGVLAVISHRNAPRLPYRARDERAPVDPDAGDQIKVFQNPDVLFAGQPLAVVVAETLEQATHAAALVAIEYEEAPAAAVFDTGRTHRPGEDAESRRGDANAAFAAAPVKVGATYRQPREHHNAIEPHATIAVWQGERLTLYDKSQWVANVRTEIGHVFGLPENNIRVIAPFVGGAFGSALRTWPHVVIAALAARVVQRPVRIELTRGEVYTVIGFRPQTEQCVSLGADASGRLAAIIHEASGQTSTFEEYTETTLSPARKLYACDNVRTAQRLVGMNTNSPCPMRAPGIVTGVFGLEMAMDELAVALRMDPVELRLRNYADRDPDADRPWSSKELRACYAAAAERFGWAKRNPRPRTMRDGHSLVGWGMASTIYGAHRARATASATLFANGSVVVRSASSDMGPGTYTSMSQIAAEMLDVPIEAVRFDLGDTELPMAPVHGGSITTASVGSAVAAACEALNDRLASLGGGRGREAGVRLLRERGLDFLEATAEAAPGEESETHSSSAFGAVFAEVRVDEDLGTVQVPRIVAAYDVGRVVNPKMARSQIIGGMVGGIGMALLEEAEWDPRFGRVMNANLAEYLVPVCADVHDLDVTFVPSDDRIFNPIGAKGLAEIAICGVAPAIANAVYHATGRRIRDLPITPDKLLTQGGAPRRS